MTERIFNRRLPGVGIHHAGGNVKAFFQSADNWLETGNEAGRPRSQNEITDAGFYKSGQRFIPGFFQQDIADKHNQADKEGRLLQDVFGKESPNGIEKFHVAS
jgi:hypothetical protein